MPSRVPSVLLPRGGRADHRAVLRRVHAAKRRRERLRTGPTSAVSEDRRDGPARGISDVQGQVVERRYPRWGWENARVAFASRRHLELVVEGASLDELQAQVEKMCEAFLANTVIESYSVCTWSNLSKPNVAVVVFPGLGIASRTSCMRFAARGLDADYVWHGDESLERCRRGDPSRRFRARRLSANWRYRARFSAGDGSGVGMASSGAPVLGICNGFQILCEEAHSRSRGASRRNEGLRFLCTWD